MRWALAISVLALAVLPASAAAQGTSSSFAQLTGADGCVTQEPPLPLSGDAVEGCARARGLLSAYSVAVSPDDKHVYVASAGTDGVGSNAVVAFSRAGDSGALTSVGCVSDSGGDGRVGTDGFCANGDALLGASDLEVSPDGRHVYVAVGVSNGISWLARDAATGALTSAGCLKEQPRADRCGGGFGLGATSGVAVSPDGRQVYVTAATPGSVSAYSRDPETGDLRPLMCVSENGSDGVCVDGTGLLGASSVTVAPDGRQVFVTAAQTGAVTTYARDAADGRLTPQSCLLDRAPKGGSCAGAPTLGGAASSAISPDGKTLFVASSGDETLSLFARDPATGALTPSSCFRQQPPEEEDEEGEEEGTDEEAEDAQADCKPAEAIGGLREVVVSPDGRGVFTIGGGDYLAAFRRDPASGTLTQTGCAEAERTYESCTQARALLGGRGLAVSGDARSLYVANAGENAVAVFGAAVAVTSRAAAADRRGRFGVRLACPAARVRGCAGRLRVAAAKARAYRVRAGASRTVRARLPKRLRKVVRKRGRVRVTVAARDTRGLMRATTRRVVVRR